MSLRERHGFWQLIHSPSLKDGRWRPKPGSKFDNVKSPPPLLVTTPLAAPKLFSPSLTTRNKRNSLANSLTSYSSWLQTSNPSLTLALLTTTLALPIPPPSVTMRSLIPNFLPASSSSSPGGPTIYLGAYRTWRALFFGSTFPATRRV